MRTGWVRKSSGTVKYWRLLLNVLASAPCSMNGKIWTAQVGPHSYRRFDGKRPKALSWLCISRPVCLRLLAQLMRAAASRAFCTAGSIRPMRVEMIAITTSSSINLKPRGMRDMPRSPVAGSHNGWVAQGRLRAEREAGRPGGVAESFRFVAGGRRGHGRRTKGDLKTGRLARAAEGPRRQFEPHVRRREGG